MDRIHCAACNAEHDLNELEPSFDRPDAYLALPPAERASRVRDAGDAIVVRDADGTARHFVRVRMPIPVRGEARRFHWLTWAEIDAGPWHRLVSAAPGTGDAGFACAGTLANAFPGYPATDGLPGTVTVAHRHLRPGFTLASDVRHPLATEQREGIHMERVLEIIGTHA